jgi:hypothetical protein
MLPHVERGERVQITEQEERHVRLGVREAEDGGGLCATRAR